MTKWEAMFSTPEKTAEELTNLFRFQTVLSLPKTYGEWLEWLIKESFNE